MMKRRFIITIYSNITQVYKQKIIRSSNQFLNQPLTDSFRLFKKLKLLELGNNTPMQCQLTFISIWWNYTEK